MYELNDTIVALSSGRADGLRHIVRLSGENAVMATGMFTPSIDAAKGRVISGQVCFSQMLFDAVAYIFPSGHSYTGDELVELHIECPLCITEKLIEQLSAIEGIRLAEPGEFTARAFFNGKLDLAQAEAVAQIVSGSNDFQLQAAQRLLQGRLSEKVLSLRMQILELLSLLEAGLDFSEEDITFITESQAAQRVSQITAGLQELITNNIKYERMIGLAAVAITGCPNAGKSSLMNAILGSDRSIVSATRATTRDVISEVLEFETCACVISDCAGVVKDNAVDQIDDIAQKAAIEAVNSSDIIVFCVDISADQFHLEQELFEMINKDVIAVATKSDLLTSAELTARLDILKQTFNTEFMPLCTTNAADIKTFTAELGDKVAFASGIGISSEEVVAVNRRHYDSLQDSLYCVKEGLGEITNNNDELAAMYLRSSYSDLSGLNEQQSIDESILDKIFSGFCIGK